MEMRQIMNTRELLSLVTIGILAQDTYSDK